MRQSKIIQEDIQNIVKELSTMLSRFEGKTILIAGGAGFLGKYLVSVLDYANEHVLKKPCKIIVVDNYITALQDSLAEKENIIILKKDISKPIKINGDVHFIIHAASLASPVFYHKFRIETIDVGFLGTKNLLELAREKKVESFLFMSSSEVYGNPDPKFIPTNEEYLGNVSCTGPRAPYDEPKRIGETLCVTYGNIYNIPVKIARPFNIYGPGMRLDDGRVVPNFVVAALKGDKIPIYSGGSNTRTFCYITDGIVGFYKMLLSNSNGECFNIGSDEHEIQMRHLADLISGLINNGESKHALNSETLDVYKGKTDPDRRCPDLTKIRTKLGYEPKTSLIAGLRRFITWAREEMENQGTEKGIKNECRICGNKELVKVLSIGKSPLANNLLKKEDLDKEELFPLDLMYCKQCHLCQLSYVAPPEKLFKHYVYLTSTTQTFKDHFKSMADSLYSKLNLSKGSLIVDVGSNDGLLLGYFKEKGSRVIGVEPAVNVADIARSNGVTTLCDFWNDRAVKDIIRFEGKADLITANNVFAHTDHIKDFAKNVSLLLKDKGVFVIECQYLLDTIKKLTFDNIYHEHVSYYSVLALKNFFDRMNMEIFDVQNVNTHGGSIRVFVQKKGAGRKVDPSVNSFIEREKKEGLNNVKTYENFAKEVYKVKDNFNKFIKDMKKQNKKIIGYGAPAKATTFLNFVQPDKNSIEYIIEDNKLKQGLIIPGVRIPIKGKDSIKSDKQDLIGIFAWNFAEEIMKNNADLKSKGAKFFIPYPEPKIVG